MRKHDRDRVSSDGRWLQFRRYLAPGQWRIHGSIDSGGKRDTRGGQGKTIMDRHRDHASHLGNACECQSLAGLFMRGLTHPLHLGAIHARGHGMAHFHRRVKRGAARIGGLLAEQAKQRSQEEKEGKASFHSGNMVERSLAAVNDYPP